MYKTETLTLISSSINAHTNMMWSSLERVVAVQIISGSKTLMVKVESLTLQFLNVENLKRHAVLVGTDMVSGKHVKMNFTGQRLGKSQVTFIYDLEKFQKMNVV